MFKTVEEAAIAVDEMLKQAFQNAAGQLQLLSAHALLLTLFWAQHLARTVATIATT